MNRLLTALKLTIMESNRHTSHTAFLTVLILLAIITVKMAFLHAAELLTLLLILIPGILILSYNDKRTDEYDMDP